jgi:murein DD-endopeptidase MepM/ murein hydrolase activator NlpD
MGWRFETKTKVGTVFGIVALSLVVYQAVFVYAQTAPTLVQDKKTILQERLRELNKQITAFQTEINKTRTQQASLNNEIKLYDNELKSTQLSIEAKETQIEDTDLQINELQLQIDRRQKEIADNKNILGQLLIELHQLDNSSAINVTLSSNDFSEFLDQVHYTTSLQDKVYDLVQNIKTIKAKLEAQQTDLKIQLDKLKDLQQQLQISKLALESQRRDKQNLLDKTKGIEKNYQKLLASSKQEEDKIEQEIDSLDESVRTKLGNRTIRPSKGVLAWPMDGILTQRYGKTGFTKLGYTFHTGIDIGAPAGKPIYAAADGKVVGADTGKVAHGNWVTLKHTIATKTGTRDIITLYAHMRSYTVKVGQTVKQGDLIGYEGNTGNTTRLLYGPERGYHLHFGVWDAEGFGIKAGAHQNLYGSYSIPYGYHYDPMDFL